VKPADHHDIFIAQFPDGIEGFENDASRTLNGTDQTDSRLLQDIQTASGKNDIRCGAAPSPNELDRVMAVGLPYQVNAVLE
jgi:hypothetical protein